MPTPMYSKKPGCSGPDCEGCSSPNCMYDGGRIGKSGSQVLSEVGASKPKQDHELAKEVAMSAKKLPGDKEVEEKFVNKAMMRSQEREADRKSRGGKYAEGGEVSGEMHVEPDEGDGEMHEMIGKELMDAIHSKDHKKIMPALEACVLSLMNKGMGDGEE